MTMHKQAGNLVCWGSGEFGQNCQSTKQDVSFLDGKLQADVFSGQVKSLACGASHTVVVTDENEIFAWGNGNSGQLGCSEIGSSLKPKKVELYESNYSNNNNKPIQSGSRKVLSVACGGRHSVILLSNGNVYSFGNNFYAQLGYDFREKNYKENQMPGYNKRTNVTSKLNIFKDDENANEKPKKELHPRLLKFLVYRPVAHVSCGDKHTIFCFRAGNIACVGCNANGQIGTDNREEAVVPKLLEIEQRVKSVACGANHSLALTDNGEVYAWGYGKACGSKSADVLAPQKMLRHTKNIMKVCGGVTHSMALSASGIIYSWGSGVDGQLGFGQEVLFQSYPCRLGHWNLYRQVVDISCGESFSAAVNENGQLYMWGKNSHTIKPDQPTNQRIWRPFCVNAGSFPVTSVACGSWHAVSVTGKPDLILQSEIYDSEDSDMEEERIKKPYQGSESSGECEIDDFKTAPVLPNREFTRVNREQTKMSLAEFYAPTPDIAKEPFSDDELVTHQTPSLGNCQPQKSTRLVVEVPISARQGSMVDVGTSPIPFSGSESDSGAQASVVSSPRKLTEQPNNKLTVPKVEPKQISESQEIREDLEFRNRIDKLDRSHTKEDIPKFFMNYERHKTCSFKQHPTSFMQVSKSAADNFMLPRENTNFTSKHIDFSEVENVRTRTAGRSPDKPMFVFGKAAEPSLGRPLDSYQSRTFIESSSKKIFSENIPKKPKPFNESIPKKPLTENNSKKMFSENGPGRSMMDTSSSRAQTIDHAMFMNIDRLPDGRVMDSPSLRSGRHSETTILNLARYEQAGSNYAMLWTRASESSLADYTRWLTPDVTEDTKHLSKSAMASTRQYQPTISIPKKGKEANFGNKKMSNFIRRRKLQISRSDTVIGPLKTPIKQSSARISQMQRYASVHNPQSTSRNADNRVRLGQPPVSSYKVSIPGSRAFMASGQENGDILCVQGQTGMKKLPVYSSASSWREKADFDRVKNSSVPKTNSANSSHSSRSGGSLDRHGSPELVSGSVDESETNSKARTVLTENCVNINGSFSNSKTQKQYFDRTRKGKLIAHGRPSSYEDSDSGSLKIDTKDAPDNFKDGAISQTS